MNGCKHRANSNTPQASYDFWLHLKAAFEPAQDDTTDLKSNTVATQASSKCKLSYTKPNTTHSYRQRLHPLLPTLLQLILQQRWPLRLFLQTPVTHRNGWSSAI